jgi:ABC-type multidrug transport system fused ATPase/permease subunit
VAAPPVTAEERGPPGRGRPPSEEDLCSRVMNLFLGFLIVAVVSGVAIAAMLLVRRRAPEGSFFSDGDRASGVFGVLATGFSVLLGFIIFLAFTSYDQSRAGAEAEALVLVQQVEAAQFFPPDLGAELTGELVCYGRNVATVEWDQMEAGTQRGEVSLWAVELFDSLHEYEPESASEQSAYDRWLDQTSTREEARRDRIHGAVGIIPSPLWVVLFFISGVIFVFMLFFADRGERARTQALLMGSVTAVIATMLLLLNFLDSPFHDDVGGLRPVAMERSLRAVDEALADIGLEVPIPCDAEGRPR